MKRTLAVLLVGLALGVAGCGGSAGTKYVYPKQDQASFMLGCTNGAPAANGRCGCALKWLENHVGYDEFARYNVPGTTPPQAWKTAIAAACRR